LWLSFDGATGTFSGFPALSDIGVIEIELTATDSGGLSVSDLFTVDVVPAPDSLVILGTDGNDTLIGTSGNDVIVGGLGYDVLSGGAGNDEFIAESSDTAYDRYNGGEGYDRVVGTDGDDRIAINRFTGEDTVEEIDGGAGTNIISGGSNHYDTLDFSNTTLVNISRIETGTLNDTVIGSAGNDVIVGGSGNDSLSGGDGDDIYLFLPGFGSDKVYNSSGDVTPNGSIEFGVGILPGDVLVSRSGDDLILTVAGTVDQVTVKAYFLDEGTSGNAVAEIRFADGSIWSVADVLGM
jgi:Ca2+-binding RTX toxin-like protein